MTNFIVNNMTCGHCVATVTKAIKQLDPDAEVNVDLASKQVTVESGHSDNEISRILEEAGYKPSTTMES